MDSNAALFLDVDGTLLEIAETPRAVKVPTTLRNTLRLAAMRLDGALALVTGRSIRELDALFSPCVFPAAGQHGLERRDVKGKYTRADVDNAELHSARQALTELQSRVKGLLFEDKRPVLAMHYRLAPHCESLVREVVYDLVEPIKSRFEVRRGKCVFEIAPRGVSKRTAIEAFMQEPPFRDRTPYFIGDDVTDEDGFVAVNALGGYSIRVGIVDPTSARYEVPDVSAVVDWLKQSAGDFDVSTSPIGKPV